MSNLSYGKTMTKLISENINIIKVYKEELDLIIQELLVLKVTRDQFKQYCDEAREFILYNCNRYENRNLSEEVLEECIYQSSIIVFSNKVPNYDYKNSPLTNFLTN